MCHPIVMTGLQVATSLMGASAQAADYKYQAKIAQMQGRYEADVATVRAARSRYAAERQWATHRVHMLNSGVDPSSASYVDVLAEDRANLAVDELDEYYRGRLALYNANLQAKTMKRAANAVMYQSLIRGAGSLLGETIDWVGGGKNAEVPGQQQKTKTG